MLSTTAQYTAVYPPALRSDMSLTSFFTQRHHSWWICLYIYFYYDVWGCPPHIFSTVPSGFVPTRELQHRRGRPKRRTKNKTATSNNNNNSQLPLFGHTHTAVRAPWPHWLHYWFCCWCVQSSCITAFAIILPSPSVPHFLQDWL